jgi:phosphoglycerate dehydrogenase-like enzyme
MLANELALAADVLYIEPLPLHDPLLGGHNVVHTPHNAGRTRLANEFECVEAGGPIQATCNLRSR